MSNSSIHPNISVVIVFAVLMLVPGSTRLAWAQAPPAKKDVDPAANPRVRAAMEAIDQRARELGLIEAGEADDTGFYRRRRNAQLSEDFTRLHSIDEEQLSALSTGTSIDYKLLSDVTAEIKRRAGRIKQNISMLLTGDNGGKIRYEEDPDKIGAMIPELSRLINSFLGSPIFRVVSANDAELRAKASRDIEGIIRLSETINKLARRVNKIPASSK